MITRESWYGTYGEGSHRHEEQARAEGHTMQHKTARQVRINRHLVNQLLSNWGRVDIGRQDRTDPAMG